MSKPKGTPLTAAQKAKMHAGLKAYHEAKAAGTWQPKKGKQPQLEPQPAAATPDESLTPDPSEELLEGDHTDLFAAHAHEIDQAIMDMVRGVRVAMKTKKVKLLRGEAEYEVETEAGETWFVYLKPPVTSLLKFAREQVKGKATSREAQVKAGTIVVKIAVPGHDAEVDAYLQSLPPETLDKLGLEESQKPQPGGGEALHSIAL